MVSIGSLAAARLFFLATWKRVVTVAYIIRLFQTDR